MWIEVNQIVVRVNVLLNKRIIDTFKRRIWVENVCDIGEYSYRAEHNYVKCGLIILINGERIKTKESYEQICACMDDMIVKEDEKPKDN
jgi:hypothetical protein